MSAQNAVNAPKSFTGLLEPVKVTRCGVRTSFEDELPNPSCPLLFLPQHFTDWSSNKAQDAPLESAILIALRPEPKSTAVGTQTPPDEVFPIPSWPSLLFPQHNNWPSLRTAQV